MIKFTSDVESLTEHLDLWEVAGICSEQAESPTTHALLPKGEAQAFQNGGESVCQSINAQVLANTRL